MTMSSFSSARRLKTWQEQFVVLLPEIQRLLRIAFRDLDPEARDDAVADGTAHCLLAYLCLAERGHANNATSSTLAWYATLQIRGGRSAACRMNSKEVLSRYAQMRKGIRVVPLHRCDRVDSTWINDVTDNRHASVLDQVAIRMDFAAWLGRLRRRARNIALDLARGFTTSEAAQKYDVTASRISQLRRELQDSWREYQGESALAAPA